MHAVSLADIDQIRTIIDDDTCPVPMTKRCNHIGSVNNIQILRILETDLNAGDRCGCQSRFKIGGKGV